METRKDWDHQKIQIRAINLSMTESIYRFSMANLLRAVHLSGEKIFRPMIQIRLQRENSPFQRGRDEYRCRILARGGSLLLEARDSDLYRAIERACDQIQAYAFDRSRLLRSRKRYQRRKWSEPKAFA
jgi:ribosome-associated translation inhibitor RaiA